MIHGRSLSLCTLLAIVTLSCGGSDEVAEVAESADPHAGHDHAEAGEPHDLGESGVEVSGLALNGDARWPMDDHTRASFVKMRAAFEAGDLESGDPQVILATGVEIRAEINELIQGCTMTGEAHNQLHHYLTAYIPAVDEMASDGSSAHAERVEQLLRMYPTYFE